jgi:hypothetical protein
MALNSSCRWFLRMNRSIVSWRNLLVRIEFWRSLWEFCLYNNWFTFIQYIFLRRWVSLWFFDERRRTQAIHSFYNDFFFAILVLNLSRSLLGSRPNRKCFFWFLALYIYWWRILNGKSLKFVLIFDFLSILLLHINLLIWIGYELLDSIKYIDFKLLFISLITLSLRQSHIRLELNITTIFKDKQVWL